MSLVDHANISLIPRFCFITERDTVQCFRDVSTQFLRASSAGFATNDEGKGGGGGRLANLDHKYWTGPERTVKWYPF